MRTNWKQDRQQGDPAPRNQSRKDSEWKSWQHLNVSWESSESTGTRCHGKHGQSAWVQAINRTCGRKRYHRMLMRMLQNWENAKEEKIKLLSLTLRKGWRMTVRKQTRWQSCSSWYLDDILFELSIATKLSNPVWTGTQKRCETYASLLKMKQWSGTH